MFESQYDGYEQSTARSFRSFRRGGFSSAGPQRLHQRTAMLRDVFLGLSGRQKSLPSKYLYDAIGSELFEIICNLPEYYPARMAS
jgi:hypothetical protein